MPIYGLVLQSDPDAAVQEWAVTEDIDDILKPDSMFIPCDSAGEGHKALLDRYPVPEKLAEALAGKRIDLTTVQSYDKIKPDRSGYVRAFRVFPQGRITGVHKHSGLYSHLAAGLVAAGSGVIGKQDDPYRSDATHHQIAHAVRRDPVFKASDLVLRETSQGYEVVRDPRKAKARRSKEASQKARDEEKVEKQKVDDAAAVKRRAVFDAAHEASAALWTSQKVTKDLAAAEAVCGYSWSWRWESMINFWRVVALHEALTRKGAWRAFKEVDDLIDAVGRAGDAFADKYLNPNANPHSYQGLSATLAKFVPEIKRLARRRKREARKAAQAAPKAVEPAAV